MPVILLAIPIVPEFGLKLAIHGFAKFQNFWEGNMLDIRIVPMQPEITLVVILCRVKYFKRLYLGYNCIGIMMLLVYLRYYLLQHLLFFRAAIKRDRTIVRAFIRALPVHGSWIMGIKEGFG